VCHQGFIAEQDGGQLRASVAEELKGRQQKIQSVEDEVFQELILFCFFL